MSSDHSPAKTYTPLQTSSPSKTATTGVQETPGTPALQSDENTNVKVCTVTPHSSAAEPVNSQSLESGKVPTTSSIIPEPNATPIRAMEETSDSINQEMYEESINFYSI